MWHRLIARWVRSPSEAKPLSIKPWNTTECQMGIAFAAFLLVEGRLEPCFFHGCCNRYR